MEADEKILEHFLYNSLYYPNKEIFDTPVLEEVIIKKKILEKLINLAKKNNEYEKTIYWFKELYEIMKKIEVNVIMYGKIVYGKDYDTPSDFDMYVITKSKIWQTKEVDDKWYNITRNRPRMMHLHDIYYDSACPIDRIEGWRRFGLLNNLILIPRSVPGWLIKTIDESREIIKNAQFFKGGVGELITYAAWKILDGKEKIYFNDEKQAELFFEKKMPAIVVTTDWGMPTPREINEAARQVFKERMTEGQLYQLALAAMRRIGIKQERRKELARKFVKELKPNKILPLPA